MKRIIKYFFIIILFFALLICVFSYFKIIHPDSALNYIAALFFEERITPEDLFQKYNSNKPLNILIVPGHDNISVGAEFQGLKEADLNAEVANDLFDLLQKDRKFNVFVTRNKNGDYNDWFSAYLENQKSAISVFRDYSRKIMTYAVNKGLVKKYRPKVYHNPASDDASLKLYGVNKWANQNDADIVIHIHFNDYPTRKYNLPGKYSGFAIYVPENQLPNSRASVELAKSIKNRLEKYFPKSNFPGEAATIVEDQQLVAVGSSGSLDAAALLVEYGYIYESQFINSQLRPLVMKELALQTYLGIRNYFEPMQSAVYGVYNTTLLPYHWAQNLDKGMRGSEDVMHLQAALLKEGFYPSLGKNLSDCPINGNFGDCTFDAVCAFQEKYKDEILSPLKLNKCTGSVGPTTCADLNRLYGN